MWRPDGKELFYNQSGLFMGVDLSGTVAGGEFKAAVPQPLFPGYPRASRNNLDVAPDGRRFLLVSNNQATTQAGPLPIVVVLNWKSGLKP